MKYSEITALAAHDERCCDGEQKFLTPCCNVEICIFCEDCCPECFDMIDWSK